MHVSRIVGIIGFVLAVTGYFLEWASIGDMISVSGIEMGGFNPVVLMFPVVVMAFLGNRKAGFGMGYGIASLILGVATAAYMVWRIVDITSVGEEYSELLEISLGAGIYVETAGGLLAAVAGLWGLKGE